MATTTGNGQTGPKPFVRIVEQPAKCAIRFRYECEGRSAGSIPGINSTPENKTFPTIQVCNYQGKAVVVVSCVTKEPPYRPHPHNLVGKEGCKKGVCTLVIDNQPDMICTFTSLGIQCVKRNKIEESLKLREMIKVDPFRTGFGHRTQASSIDLNCLRLCFQVFIEGPEKGKFTVQLPPIVSDAIYDKKAMAELIIVKLSHYSAPCTGGKEIILLCDRVAKDDIQVRFYHQNEQQNGGQSGGGLIWEAYGDFLPNDVHKQVAISLRTPKYFDENITQPVTVYIQLRRPSDGCLSLPRSFQITPRELDPDGLVRKRHKRLKEENYDLLQEYIQLATSSRQSPTKIPTPSPAIIKTEMPATPVGVASAPSSSASPRPGFSVPVQTQTTTQHYHQQQFIQQQQQQQSPSSSPVRNSPKLPPYTSPTAAISTTSYGSSPSSNNYGSIMTGASPVHQFQIPEVVAGSPNPSQTSSYPSPSPSPAIANQQQQQQQQQIPNEVMERFDSLDIDSSELIPDLDFNSNTMLSLMMDTSSGLSLNDSFSDFNQQMQLQQQQNLDQINGNLSSPATSSNSTKNGSTAATTMMMMMINNNSSQKLKQQQQPITNISLDTPIVDNPPGGFNTGDQTNMILNLDLDNNNHHHLDLTQIN